MGSAHVTSSLATRTVPAAGRGERGKNGGGVGGVGEGARRRVLPAANAGPCASRACHLAYLLLTQGLSLWVPNPVTGPSLLSPQGVETSKSQF